MRRSWLTIAAVTAAAGLAGAEPPPDVGDPDGEAFEPPPDMGKGKTFTQRIEEQLTLLGESVDGHVGALTLDTIKFRIDGASRRARLRIAGGESRYLSLRVEGDVYFRRGAAEVTTKVDLSLAGHTLRFELPEFEVLPRSYLGERYVEVRVPIIRGSF